MTTMTAVDALADFIEARIAEDPQSPWALAAEEILSQRDRMDENDPDPIQAGRAQGLTFALRVLAFPHRTHEDWDGDFFNPYPSWGDGMEWTTILTAPAPSPPGPGTSQV